MPARACKDAGKDLLSSGDLKVRGGNYLPWTLTEFRINFDRLSRCMSPFPDQLQYTKSKIIRY
jgi:hypothetical protein